MSFAVVHEGQIKNGDDEAYTRLLSRQLLKRGVDVTRVPRVREDHAADSWLYVWEEEADASAFAAELKKQTKDRRWIVRPVTGRTSVGPLRPLEVIVGRQREGWVFGLPPLTRKAIQLKFPTSCAIPQVFIGSEAENEFLANPQRLRKLAEQALRLLTELSPEQLAEFGSFRVIDPVDQTEFLPPSPLR